MWCIVSCKTAFRGAGRGKEEEDPLPAYEFGIKELLEDTGVGMHPSCLPIICAALSAYDVAHRPKKSSVFGELCRLAKFLGV